MDRTEMLNSVAWLGQTVMIHEIGEYAFVEYKPKVFEEGNQKIPTEYNQNSNFAAFINGKGIGRSYESLDAALVGAIAYKHDGANTKADHYFMKAISK